MFIFLYTVFRNSSISDEHVFCVALHFTIGQINLVALRSEFFEVESENTVNDKLSTVSDKNSYCVAV